MSRVALGCERLLTDEAERIRGRRIGLITNHSGVDTQLCATADRLHQFDLCQLVALYGPSTVSAARRRTAQRSPPAPIRAPAFPSTASTAPPASPTPQCSRAWS